METADGICDDEDACVGILDECGVCNGPGPTEVVIEDITILYDSVYLPQLEEWYVYEFGADTTFSFECLPLFPCGDPVSYQGYDYATVLIGDQCWFAENLRSENYENGDAIPSGLSASEWTSAWSSNSGATAVYPNNFETYGRLYNWYAVDDARGLCPSGWHVPTDGEWAVMTSFLGGASVAGGPMKTTYGWYNDGNGTNSSGFSGLPGGWRNPIGTYNNAGKYGYWWSSSSIGSGAVVGTLKHYNTYAYLYDDEQFESGFSVRCVRDAE